MSEQVAKIEKAFFPLYDFQTWFPSCVFVFLQPGIKEVRSRDLLDAAR